MYIHVLNTVQILFTKFHCFRKGLGFSFRHLAAYVIVVLIQYQIIHTDTNVL